jgi:hypothetical protein
MTPMTRENDKQRYGLSRNEHPQVFTRDEHLDANNRQRNSINHCRVTSQNRRPRNVLLFAISTVRGRDRRQFCFHGQRFSCRLIWQGKKCHHVNDRATNVCLSFGFFAASTQPGGEQVDRMTETEWPIGMRPNHVMGKIGMRPNLFWPRNETE